MSKVKHQILVVEDEVAILTGIKSWLEIAGYEVDGASDGLKAIEKINSKKYDCIILDVMMPKLDGYGVLEYLRSAEKKWTPVIMLTAKSDEDDKIMGLKLGADDYMTKPFSNRELEARIEANVRRFAKEIDKNELNVTGFAIDMDKYKITNDDLESELTRKEMELLRYLVKNPNVYIKKIILLEAVWGYKDSEDTRTLDIHISKLRRKLDAIGVVDVIKTKRGVGYAYETGK